MPRRPIPNNRGKFPNLKTDPRMYERSVAKKIFVESDLGALIRGIETTVETRLGEEIKVVCELRVEEERHSWIEKETVVGLDKSGRALIDEITFRVDQPAQLQLETVLRIADRQCVVHPVKQIGAGFEHKHETDRGAEDVDLTSHELVS